MSGVHVIIINWNAGPLLGRCLDSFAAVADDAVKLERVTVVDNASTDGSMDDIGRFLAKLPLRVVHNAENRGYAAACNQAAAGSTAEFLLFLNPDTELGPGCLDRPTRFLADAANARAGIVGVQLRDATGRIARSCARRPTLLAMIGRSVGLDRLLPSFCPPHFLLEWPHTETRVVDQVSGAFYLVRRSLFERLDGFDERFFVYYEHLDLALRAQDLGWLSIYLATTHAVHLGGGTTRAIKDRRLFYSCRSRLLFGMKYFGAARGGLLAVVMLLAEPVARLAVALISLRVGDVKETLRGFAMLWADLPNIFHPRHRRSKPEAGDV